MSDLEARPGKVGKSYPATGVNGNTAPVAQANNYGDRLGWVVALILGLIAIVAVAFLFAVIRSIGTDLDNVRGLSHFITNGATSWKRGCASSTPATNRMRATSSLSPAP